MSKSQPWLSWFARHQSDGLIRTAAYLPVKPIRGLSSLTVNDACQRLNAGWSTAFVPGPQHIQILRSLLDRAHAYAMDRYPSVTDYNRLRSASPPTKKCIQPTLCLTGLAGVSKSSLMQALERICQLEHGPEYLTDEQQLRITPVRRLEIDGQSALQGVLRSMANPLALQGRKKLSTDALMEHVRDWLLATATSTLTVDEMQFFTQSSSASTKTSQLIMALANLGSPLVYVANFSLIRKLTQRPQEERDRLLSNPIVLHPPTADDPWWISCLSEYLSICPATFRLNVEADALELHRYTAGLFRALRHLLLQSYKEARTEGKLHVTIDDVRRSYKSSAYSSHRKDVEDLNSLSVSDYLLEKRSDLVCPFMELRPHTISKTKATASHLSSARTPWPELDIPSAMVESTLSSGARKKLKALRSTTDQPSSEPSSATVIRLPRREPVSAQSLLQGAQTLREALKDTRRTTKPVTKPDSHDA
ncbi:MULTISPECIES: AAA family ATPase [unclassified Comamonas]|uniref:AAA family ATPase n=1 Tax=unclassified Comamonas TaxID=2638500 RepID=UPI001FA6ADE7|nr:MULTISPECIES: AAA family ATPase [unclassified Comamonas]UNV90453.1 AAA family ATPase [Comamonas sp. 7D-2evo1]UNV96245.1 AAA family ATPase [Comamonas sp. 7D-2]UNW00090.1 AAA family ATPase [Comamonas sp. 7D-2evo2]